MDRYKIVLKGVFQRTSAFEEQINGLAAEGWRVVTAGGEGVQIFVVMERQR